MYILLIVKYLDSTLITLSCAIVLGLLYFHFTFNLHYPFTIPNHFAFESHKYTYVPLRSSSTVIMWSRLWDLIVRGNHVF